MIRVVLDANVLISGLIQPRGPSGRIQRRIFGGRDLVLVLSPLILDEVRRILTYPRIRRRLGATDEDLTVWALSLAFIGDLVEPSHPVTSGCRDPDDDKYIEAAIEGGAGFIVTGDQDLLELKEFQGVRIIAPRTFESML